MYVHIPHSLFCAEKLPASAIIRLAVVSVNKDERKNAIKMCPNDQLQWRIGKHNHKRGVNREEGWRWSGACPYTFNS